MSKNFELMQKRLQFRGGSVMERMVNDKQRTFFSALAGSFNSEDVEKNGLLFKAIINDKKQEIELHEKVLAAPLETGLKVGDVIYWPRINRHWLITTKDITEKSYFRGDIREAIHNIKWRDSDGNICETWAALKGPSENSIPQGRIGSTVVDQHSSTIILRIGATDKTKFLKRYGYLMISNKTWRINFVDDITNPDITEVGLIENYIDKEQDNMLDHIARDYENMTAPPADKSDGYTIDGIGIVDPIVGLTQIYTITPQHENGVLTIDATYGKVIGNTVVFNGKTGTTSLSYVIDNNVVATKTIKITSLLG